MFIEEESIAAGDASPIDPDGDCSCEQSEISSVPADFDYSNGSSSGCTTCGSTGDMNLIKDALPPEMRSGGVHQRFLPNNRVHQSSFGLGVYSQFDSQMDLFEEEDGNALTFFDAVDGRVYLFVDGLDGDTEDGVFHDLRNKHARKIELLNSSSALTTSLASAATAKVTLWSGYVENYEIIDLNPDPTESEFAARLVSRVSPTGRTLAIGYKSFTSTQIEESPDRQWQIDTVEDPEGRELTFTYGTAQEAGRWVVTSIARNFGSTTTFEYDDYLTTVNIPGGRETTFTYGQDTYTQTATVEIKEGGIGGKYQGRTVKHYLTQDYMTLDTNGTLEIINQPSGIHRMVESENGGTEWLLIPNSDPEIDEKFVLYGGLKAKVVSGNGTFRNVISWEYGDQAPPPEEEPSGPPPPIANQVAFMGIEGDISEVVVGAVSATTLANLRTGELPGYLDEAGREITVTYDSDGNPTSITNEVDSTVINRTYNTFGKPTRVRHRDGSVEKFTYDSSGNLTTVEKGIKEQSGSDVQTSQYAVTTKEYYGSTHASAGMLKAEMTALYNSSTPTLHRTDYEYDSQKRLTKKIGPAVSSGQARPEWTYSYNTAGLLYQETNPEGHTITYTYDNSGSLTQKSYADSTTEQTLYGTDSHGNTGKILKKKDRMGVVDTFEFDDSGRLIKHNHTAAIDANILDGNADDTVITDVNLKQVTEYVYVDGSDQLKSKVKVNGSETDYVYDFRNRLTETKQYPRSGVTLSSKKVYLGDLLFYDEDPQGRRKYYGYRASDRTLIRTITCTVPEHSFADFEEVWDATRNTSANALYVIHDAIRDDVGRLTQVIDGRGTETRYEYDGQGRETTKKSAYGTSLLGAGVEGHGFPDRQGRVAFGADSGTVALAHQGRPR